MSSIIARLEEPKWVRFQMLMHLYFARIYKQSRRRYNELFNSCDDRDDDDHNEDSIFNLNDNLKPNNSSSSNNKPRSIALADEPSTLKSTTTKDATKEDIKSTKFGPKFPTIWPPFIWFDYLSTSWLLYTSIKLLLPNLVDELVQRLFRPQLPVHCYLLGRFELHEQMNRLIGWLFSSFHIVWRSHIFVSSRPYTLTLILFMLQSDRAIDNFYELMRSNNHELTSSQLESSAQLRLICRIMCYRLNSTSSSSSSEAAAAATAGSKRISIYKVRPNRSLESRRKLIRLFARTTFYSTILLLTSGALVMSSIGLAILRDERYSRRYPQCAGGHFQVRPLPGVELNWHRWLSGAADLLENALVWVDSGVAISFVWLLGYMLNYDLLIYWKHLHAKVYQVLAATRTKHFLENNLASYLERQAATQSTPRVCRRLAARRRSNTRHKSGASCRSISSLVGRTGEGGPRAQGRTDRGGLEYRILELQSEILDFFKEIDRVDLIVSDILTMALACWLAVFAFAGELSLNYYGEFKSFDVLLITLCLQTVGMISTVGVSSYLLGLNRCCRRTYENLCSLMAYDCSRYKVNFIRILEFYTVRKRSYYTILQMYPYSSTTFLSIVSWSISCFLIFDGLTRQHNIAQLELIRAQTTTPLAPTTATTTTTTDISS